MSEISSLRRHALESTLGALQQGGSTERLDAFLDELLLLAGERGSVTCTVVDTDTLRVQTDNGILCEIPVLRARPKLRTLCARLSVRCREWSGQDISPYGDEVEFEYPVTKQLCKVEFDNTPDSQRINIKSNSGS